MKRRFVAVLVFLLIVVPALAREEKADPKVLRAFDIKLREAQEQFQKNNLAAVKKAVDEAEALIPDRSETLNIRGAILYKEKKYPEAMAIFQTLIQRDPSSYAARFNASEVLFMQEKYEEARASFEEILTRLPGNEPCQLRIVMILAMEGKIEEARGVANKMPRPGQTAAYYYANAAIEYVLKNPKKAADWIQQSETLFPPNTSTDLRDVLIEHGLMKR